MHSALARYMLYMLNRTMNGLKQPMYNNCAKRKAAYTYNVVACKESQQKLTTKKARSHKKAAREILLVMVVLFHTQYQLPSPTHHPDHTFVYDICKMSCESSAWCCCTKHPRQMIDLHFDLHKSMPRCFV